MKYDHICCRRGARLAASCRPSVRGSPALGALLEAGPDFPDFTQLPDMLKLGWGTVNLEARAAGSPYNWSFTGTATPDQGPMPVPRGKVLGGSSAINGQTFIRGAPEDYDTWASRATMAGPTWTACPTSASWRTTPTFTMTSTALTARSRYAIISARPGQAPRRHSFRPPPPPGTHSIPT